MEIFQAVTSFYVFQFLPIVLLEAIVMWRFKWGSLKRSLIDSLMINFASMLGLVLGIGPYIRGAGPWGLALFGTYCLMVEGVILLFLDRHPARKVWLVAFAANICSCILLAGESFMKWLNFWDLFR